MSSWINEKLPREIKCQFFFPNVAKQFILCIIYTGEKDPQHGLHCTSLPATLTDNATSQSYFISNPVKMFIPTFRQRLFPNIKLTVTIRVWRLHLRTHVLFPLSLSHTLLFLVKRCHSGSNSVFFIDCWLQMPWPMW